MQQFIKHLPISIHNQQFFECHPEIEDENYLITIFIINYGL
jgi:hypothetical protein